MRKAFGMLVALALVGGMAWLAFRPVPVAVDTASIERGGLEVTLDHEGRTRVRERYRVRAPLAGNLLRIHLDPGDPIRAGETVLAIIDPLDPALLDDRALARAEAQVKRAEAALERAQKLRDRAGDQARITERLFLREQALARKGATGRDAVDRAEREFRLWSGELHAAEAAVAMARFDLELARAGLVRTRPRPEELPPGVERRIVIKAPIDGRVFRVPRESAGPVTAGETLLEIGDPSDLEIVADYLSRDAVRMKPGMKARIWGWGGPELAAHVRRIEPSGFTRISALGVEEQRVNVILDLDRAAPPEGLGDAFRVEVKVLLAAAQDVLKIPEAALFRHRGEWAAFFLEEGRARLRVLSIGLRNGFHAQVLPEGGFQPGVGATVILHPPDDVAEGTRVEARSHRNPR